MRSPLPLLASIVALCTSLSAQEAAKVTTRLEPRQPPFTGEWRPENPEYGMRSLRIADSSGNWLIHAWGQCTPRPCDWGERPLTLLSTNPVSADFQRGFATWDHGFATSYMIVRMDGDALIAEIYTLFKDKSSAAGRSHYFVPVRFVKAKSAGQG